MARACGRLSALRWAIRERHPKCRGLGYLIGRVRLKASVPAALHGRPPPPPPPVAGTLAAGLRCAAKTQLAVAPRGSKSRDADRHVQATDPIEGSCQAGALAVQRQLVAGRNATPPPAPSASVACQLCGCVYRLSATHARPFCGGPRLLPRRMMVRTNAKMSAGVSPASLVCAWCARERPIEP
jgi:hypothetical protein